MKIIFSRKGIDSSTAPCAGASPQFKDGSFLPLPIPYKHSPVTYADLVSEHIEVGFGALIEALTAGRADLFAHCDPDLRRSTRNERHPEWRPAFGQAGSALKHLQNQGVTLGDLFLFYGRFRSVVGPPWHSDHDAASYYKNGDFQAVWGWLRIGAIVDLDRSDAPRGNADHPHAHGSYTGGNALYLASDTLGLPGCGATAGAGILRRLRPLTKSHSRASEWFFDKTVLSRQRQEHVGDSLAHPHLLDIAANMLSESAAPT